MTVGEPSAELPAVDDAAREAAADVARPADAPAAPSASAPVGTGLGALHATLDRVVTSLGLRSLTVVLDDPDLGRQAFRAGLGPFESGTLSGAPGSRSDPPLPPDRVDGELLVELCATALRLEIERAGAPGATGMVVAELALRSLPGVHAVVVEQDDEVTIVQVHASADAPPDLARAAARASAPIAEARLVIELVREAASPKAAAEAQATSPTSEEVTALDAAPLPPDGPAIVAVRNDAEGGEIEVHLRNGEVRTIGRAPLTQGLAGAVNATLDALRSADPGLELALAWARTIETTADRRFVVAVSLLHPGTRDALHGLAAGVSPIEAAARAALDAVARTDATAP